MATNSDFNEPDYGCPDPEPKECPRCGRMFTPTPGGPDVCARHLHLDIPAHVPAKQ